MKRFYIIPEAILIKIIMGLLFLLMLVPLITFSDFYFPFIVPRNLYFRVIVELLFAVYIMLVLQDRRYLPKKSFILTAFASFVGLMSLSSLINGTFIASFWSNYERMDGLITYYHLLAFFVVLYGTFKERRDWDKLIQASLFISMVVAFVGLSQKFGVNILLASSGGERISSTLGNATYLAAYLLIHIYFAVYSVLKNREYSDFLIFRYGIIALDAVLIFFQIRYGFLENTTGIGGQIFSNAAFWIPFLLVHIAIYATFFKKLDRRVLSSLINGVYVFLMILFLYMISITQTRSAIIGFAASLVVAYVLIIFRKGERRSVRLAMSGIILAGIIGVGLIFQYRDTEFIRTTAITNKIVSISLTDATTVTRLATWRASLKGFAERPIFGWGVENFQQVFNRYFPTIIYTDEGTPLWFDRPHNLVIQYLVEGGIVGLLAYLVMIVGAAVLLLRKKKSNYVSVALVAFMTGYFVQNFFVFDSANSYIPFFAGLAFIAYLVSGTHDEGSQGSARPVSFGIGATTMTFVAVLILSGAWALNARALHTNTAFVRYYQDLSAQTAGKTYTKETLDGVFEVIDNSPYLGKFEILGVLSEFTTGLLQERGLSDSDLAPIVTGLVSRFEDSIRINNRDARLNLFYMNLLLNAIRLDPAYGDRVISLGTQTISLSPTRPHIYYVIGRAYMIQKNYAEGVAMFKKAVELAPDVFDSHWNLFAAYVSIHDQTAAEAEYQQLKRFGVLTEEKYRRIASIYISTGDIVGAEKILKEASGEYSTSPALYAALADVYAVQGKNAESRAAVAKALELDPSLKEQADAFLKELAEGKLKR